jgi:hypothetical protein
VGDVLRSPGRPLDAETRAFFEPRFGFDLSSVRVHADARAGESARAVRALAYTVGPHVVLGEGRLNPQGVAGKRLLAHELAHVVQQSSGSSPPVLARKPSSVREATDAERREVVDDAARFLTALSEHVDSLRRTANVALATTPGSAAGPRAYHERLNQGVVARLLNNAISIFEAQRSDNPLIDFPSESPEQTRLGDAYSRALEQLALAMDEARANAANLDPTRAASEESLFAANHLRWLEANPSAPLGAGIRSTFTQAEVDRSTRRHARVETELGNIEATLHQFNLAGNGAGRLRTALLNSQYRLVPGANGTRAERDATHDAVLQRVFATLDGIEWALSQAIGRLGRAESRTRAFASDPAANGAVGSTLQTHFATRDTGYATLLADRFARMTRELRGQGSLAVHATRPQDPECGVGSIGGGLSVVGAHAAPNEFHFCGSVTVGNEETVSTVIHETVHAVIPALGANAAITSSSNTPDDRAYSEERIYSRLTTEEALHNAESYAFYVDQLLGVATPRAAAPEDTLTGCAASDEGTLRDAIARSTYRIRLGAMWAGQMQAEHRTVPLPQHVLDVIGVAFPGADEARARAILVHAANLAGSLDYYLPVVCRGATDAEALAGALVYGPARRATASGVTATSHGYPAQTLRICPAWLSSTTALREDSLTSILAIRYRSTLPMADVDGIVRLVRHIQEQAHPSVSGRTLAQHRAADAPPPTP